MAKLQSAQAIKQAAVSIRYALDPVLWAADCLDFICDKWQADFLRGADQRTCLVCSRRSGKSASTAILAAHIAKFRPGSLILIICPAQEQSIEMLRTVRSYLTHPNVDEKLDGDAKTTIELVNGSRIKSVSATDSVRGFTPDLIVMDECQKIVDQIDEAIRPMLGLKARPCRLIKLGTPAGQSGNFFEAAHNPNWKVIKINGYECGRFTNEFLERELYEKGELYFNREYLNIFSDSEFSFFGSDMIAAAFDCDAEPLQLPIFT